MMVAKIKIWKPLDNIGGSFWFENMSLTNENFVFIYKKDKQHNTKIHIICGGGLPSFTYTNETYQENFEHVDSLEEVKAVRPWAFYTVEDSEYLKKISCDSGGLSDHLGFTHYCIITLDEVLDLVYSTEPVVELVVDGVVVASSDPEHKSLE